MTEPQPPVRVQISWPSTPVKVRPSGPMLTRTADVVAIGLGVWLGFILIVLTVLFTPTCAVSLREAFSHGGALDMAPSDVERYRRERDREDGLERYPDAWPTERE